MPPCLARPPHQRLTYSHELVTPTQYLVSRGAWIGILAVLLSTSIGAAQSVADFYRGKTGNGVCPAWRDGKYPKMCACLQQSETEYRWFVNTLIITIGCFIVGELSLLLAL